MTPDLPNPPLPALSRKEFEDGCGYAFRGIWLCEDDDGNYVYAYGHADKATYASAVNDLDAEMIGNATDDPYTADDVHHLWAVTLKPADDPDGWLITWPDDVTDQTPGSFPMTVVNR